MANELAELVTARVRTGDRQILQTVREWDTAEGHFSAFYFRGEVCGGEAVPVYAVLGIPAGGGPFPGVLHFHGGGQTANPDLVEALVREGYACISFDWTGPREGIEREHVTRWNREMRYSSVDPDDAYLIRALTAGRQCLSLLAEHPRVDGARLGEFGISWGGYQTWLLNAIDDRLSAGIAIYGCGITPARARGYFQVSKGEGPADFDAKRWFALFHPARYARQQHAPVLFVNGTNDFFGWMNGYRLLARTLDGRHRCAFAPHLNHAVGSLNPTMLAWLDHHLRGGAFPAAPVLEVERQSDGLLLRSPRLPGAQTATFYVATETGIGPDLFWHPYTAELRQGEFRVTIPAPPCRRLLAYAHQRWADGLEQSSVPVRVEGEPGLREEAETMFPPAPEFWHGPTWVDPFYPYLPLAGDAAGPAWEATERDLTYQFNTRLPAEARYRPARGQRFFCYLDGPVQDPVTVALLRYAGTAREQRYLGEFPPAALAEGIPLAALKRADGQGLREMAGLSHLYIGGTTKEPGVVRLVAAGWR